MRYTSTSSLKQINHSFDEIRKTNFFTPDLQTERLFLRKIRKSDRSDIFSYCSKPEVSEYVTWEKHRFIEDTDRFINSVLDDYQRNAPGVWGICEQKTDQIIGSIGIHNFDEKNQKIEIGYILSPLKHRKGYMTEALSFLTQFIFKHYPVHRIQIQCVEENIASAGVIEKSGYQFEALLIDYIFFRNRRWNVKQYYKINPQNK